MYRYTYTDHRGIVRTFDYDSLPVAADDLAWRVGRLDYVRVVEIHETEPVITVYANRQYWAGTPFVRVYTLTRVD